MNKIILKRTIFIFVFLPFSSLLCQKGQSLLIRESFPFSLNNSYKLSAINILPRSEKIIVKNDTLKTGQYKFDYSAGSFSLSKNVKLSLLDTLIILYKSVPLSIKKEFKKRELIFLNDPDQKDSLKSVKQITQPLSSELIFGNRINKSGAIVRGFTLGTNNDFTLNSGLRLQMSGKLSDDMEIVAALTDENTPIQPEGNTEKLDEFDKVFIELKHPNAVGTFGDYELKAGLNSFSAVKRKLQGLKGEFISGNTKGTIAIAGARGKFNSNKFNGSDGNQGPYRLTGANNEIGIIIIAGSERVYIDGMELKRGENNDYIIDYSTAEITFTPKKLITSASRISADFEYTDLNFKRNFFGSEFATNLFEGKLKIGIGYFRESDDETNPIDFTFTDDDRSILSNAGNNRFAAVRSGISTAIKDSAGNIHGLYTKIDTLINGTVSSYYKYLPGAASSHYNVTFNYVGEGNGDYIKETIYDYRFAGAKKGSYMPIIFIPMPELKQIGDLSISAHLFESVKLSAELSGSNWDKNKISSVDDENNFGYARKINLDIAQRDIKIGGSSLGKIGLSFTDRFIQGRFAPLDRINDVEFERYYNIQSSQKRDQSLREINLFYTPAQYFDFTAKYGSLKEGDDFYSDRIYSKINAGDKSKYQVELNLDYVNSLNSNLSTDWLRSDGKSFVSAGSFKFGLNYNYERKEDKISYDNTILGSSLIYAEIIPFTEYKISQLLDAQLSYSQREESFPLNGIMAKQSSASTGQLQLNFRGLKEFTSTLSVSVREKKYSSEFKSQGFTDNQTLLFLSQNRVNLWSGFFTGDLFYQAATEQTARLEKLFLKVPKGTGTYTYMGDLNNNGIADENEFQLSAYDADFVLVTLPTEKLYPIIAVKTNSRFRFDFGKIITGDGFWDRILKPVSNELSFRVEENSKSENIKDLYLLNLSKFLNDSTTIRGSQLLQNDFNLFQNSNDFSFRIRFLQRRSFNQFSSGNERGFFRERGFRLRIKLIDEISNQTEFISQTDNMISPSVINKARQIKRNDISTDFSYRPEKNVEVGFKIAAGESTDYQNVIPNTVDLNSVSARINISFENTGRLRMELERTELISASGFNDLPFEITRGNVIGKNYFVRLFFDYRISNFVQTSLSYDARILGSSRVVHTFRGEARAYF